jgi:uncharacterized protein
VKLDGMERRRIAGALCAGAALAFAGAARAEAGFDGAQPTKSHYGAIFHIDDGSEGTIKKTLNNIENLLHDPRLKGRIEIELIANSKGFAVYVKGNGFEQKLRELQKDGVILAQCSNTLRELKIDRSDLYPFISIVPSGMGEITIREAQGWAYIHPTPPEQNSL